MVVTTISNIPIPLQHRIRNHCVAKNPIREALTITINLTKNQKKYIETIPKKRRSLAIREMIDDYVFEIRSLGVVHCSRSELVRVAVLSDMKKGDFSVAHRLILMRIFSSMRVLGKKQTKEHTGRPLSHRPLGNIYHPHGEWRKNHAELRLIRWDTNPITMRKVTK